MMSDIESIVREVDSSMTMEGMPLHSEDKDRIRKCLENPGSLEKIVGSLVKKRTVSVRPRKTAGMAAGSQGVMCRNLRTIF